MKEIPPGAAGRFWLGGHPTSQREVRWPHKPRNLAKSVTVE